jgi:intracellular sulfur oxidation DsrE/DsrF family protein
MGYKIISVLSSLILLTLAAGALAGTPPSKLERLLAQAEAPPGVVFEIVTANKGALRSMVPEVSRYAERLRQRFPGLDIAVVTHGAELFSLMESEQDAYSAVHAEVRALTGEQDISVYVCGNHASWRGKSPEDFPDYVEVSPAAPATIDDYRQLGYVVIIL